MKRLLPIIFLALLYPNKNALGQKTESQKITITGIVLDSLTGKGIEYPTVALFDDSLKLIKAVAGGVDGKFTIEAPSPGQYYLSGSMIGYSNSKDLITLKEGEKKVDFGAIKLIEGMQLKEVTVTAVQPLIKNEPDKLTYNLESDPQSASSPLVDILRKVPMLSVDGEDVVRLNGETNFKVLVNGRSSGLLVRNFKDAIKAMPASAIKSVEVITNPPAKYDAEGIGGVINIITNRKSTQGYNGSINAGANTLGGYNGGGYISAQIGKLSLSTNIYTGKNISKGSYYTSESENFLSNEFKYSKTTGTSNSEGRFSNLSIEASYEIDSLNLITLSGWGFLGNSKNIGTSMFESRNADNILSRKYSTTNVSEYLYGSGSGSISYQKTFKKPEQNLTFSYSIDASPTESDFTNNVIPELNFTQYSQRSANKAMGMEHTLQADYYNPIGKKHNIETGIKYILRQNYSKTDVEIFNPDDGVWNDAPEKINDLDYDQHIGNMYGGYAYKHKSLSLKGGFRMEYTINDGVSKSSDGDITFTNKQFDVVPYINFSYMLKKGNSLSASFTQRLNRPGIWHLNPYVNDNDPMNISYGNPNLETVRRNAITIGYRKSSQTWNLSVNLAGNFTRNNIERIRRVDAEGISRTTYENIGINRNYRLNFNYSYRKGEKLNLYVNGGIAYTSISSPEMNLSNDGVSYYGGAGLSAKVWNKGTVNLNGFVYGGDVSLQSQNPVNYTSSIGFSQRFLKDKLTLSIYVSEPLSKTKSYKISSQDTTYKMTSENTYIRRSANISLFWRFGKFNVNVKKARRSSTDDKMSSSPATTTP
ncbi:MAG: hypothetical protein BGO30_01395 [Bacteroidetes bacterium 41-46]|nr:MAG: hypothetical protein BGO30_01395 [Bacteroidetes bacterium 41-46]